MLTRNRTILTTATRLFALTTVAVFTLTATTPQSGAATISFQEGLSPSGAYTQDAVYIRQSEPDTNQNSDPDQELIAGFTNDDNELRTLLEFNVSAIPSSNTIDSASLVLNTGGGLSSSITINVHEYGLDFAEASATWNDPDVGSIDAAGGTLGTLLNSATFNPTVTADITFADSAAFRTAVSDALAGDGFVRLILARSDSSGGGTQRFARFRDETITPAANRPELIVTHSAGPVVPEPSTAMLAVITLLGLGLLRLRRHGKPA